ncbi:ATP-binding protein [Fulvivirgaceae bacterium BMA12]|uniref:histidine kinase n=1 Tax=Agaribacillus aureus TaxID=3051825 RepID=A0ABT8LEF1_9BACT|nr:ATP-binding protein [Fulvivirgaceae bacterium BMA12]
MEFPQLSPEASPDIALENPIVKRYNTEHGLPEGWARIYTVEGVEYFRTDLEFTEYSVYQFDEKTEHFHADSTFGDRFGVPDKNVFPILNQDPNGFIWMRMKLKDEDKTPRILVKKGKNGVFTPRYFHEERFTKNVVRTTYLDNEVAWFGGETLIQYDLNSPFNPLGKFNAFVRSVNTVNDSIIFRGHSSREYVPALRYAQNALRLEFGATSFEREALNQFQYKLEGFDEDWSDWTLETKKDYTNLNQGTYTFKVRAKNIYGTISNEDHYSFEIIPPWFSTWWAYLLYGCAFIGFISAIVRWRSRQLFKEKEKLEQIVAERTQEVNVQTKQLKIQKEKLQELDQTKSRFFANISHEFRTPLTLILGILEDKIAQNLSSQDQRDFDIMHRNAQRLQRLINQLLDLSKLEAGSLKLEVTSQNIYEFLSAVVSSFNSHAHQRGINFSVQIPSESLSAYFDQDKVEKIIYNLLSNAFKFTPDGGKITMRASTDGKDIILSVQDNGPGMTRDQLQRIFDRFYQIDDAQTRENEGTGIGLALTKELTALHHGQIYVESTPNVGSTFTVSFPIRSDQYDDSEIVQATGVTVADKNGEEKSQTISGDNAIPSLQASIENEDAPILLIVEDNEDLRNYIRKHLPQFKILEAENGVDGLQAAQEHVPDLIVSDVMMPKMDGVTLLQCLKTNEKTSHIPVILLTARADVDSKIAGLQTGADDYLTKPFNARELNIRIVNLIDQRNKLKALFSSRITLEPKEIAITSADERFIKRVMDLINQNMDNSDFDVETFQKEVGMSRMQLHRKLKALTGCSTSEFIRVQRLKRAAQMLEAKADNISQIAYLTGFSNLSYFAKCFKEQFGVSPSAYVRQKQSAQSDN